MNKFIKRFFKKRPKYTDYWPKDVRLGIKTPDGTIYEYLKEKTKDSKNANCISYFDRHMTYKQFFRKVDLVSKSLLKLGVKEKDVVTICMPNTPEALIAFYACNNIGAIANMVHQVF